MATHVDGTSDCSHPGPRTRLWQAVMVADESIKVGGMTTSFLLALADSADLARSDAVIDAIDVPVWMPLGTGDVYVDNATAEQVCHQMGDCELQKYENAKHCLFEEADTFYDPFLNDLIRFLHRQSTP